MVRYSWNSPPEVIWSPRGTIRLRPTKLAGYSILISAALPVGVGGLNAREIQLKTIAGELTPSQGRQQHIVNAAATGVGVGGAWLVPAGANATAVVMGVAPAPGAVGLTAASTSAASVAVPATIAAVGGFCLAYDISIIQGTTNRMIEGQPLWPITGASPPRLPLPYPA